MDNYPYNLLKIYITNEQSIDYKLVEPHYNRVNLAERNIQTFKYHLIDGLCATDSKFTIVIWDTLTVKFQDTLNIIQKSHTNPKLSAYTKLGRNFDLNKMTLLPTVKR